MFCPIGVPLIVSNTVKICIAFEKNFIIVVDIINEIIRKNLTLWRARRPHPQV